MIPSLPRTTGQILLGWSLLLLPLLADPAAGQATGQNPAQKLPNYSGYVTVGDVVGEIVKADDKHITVQVTWYEPQVRGGAVRRPPIGNRNFRNPLAPNMNRPRNPPRVTVKEHKVDYDFRLVPESLIRSKTLPPKYDENGKRVSYTSKEIEQLRAPAGAPGYAASVFDLVPGTIVEVVVMRDRNIPAAKATDDDLCVKYVIILGSNRLTPNLPVEKEKSKKKDKA